MPIKRLFLSSTGRDLQPYRDAVYNRVQAIPDIKVVRMEDFASSDKAPLQTCIDAVLGSDILVGLVGVNFGSTPPGESRSFTQIEYDVAREARIPCLMHIAPMETRFAASVRETDAQNEKQTAFRNSIKQELTVGRAEHWQSPELLASFVSEAVSQKLYKMLAPASLPTPAVMQKSNSGRTLPKVFTDRHSFKSAPEMVQIERGRFQMGSTQEELDRDSCEGPRHDVVIHRSFAIGRYPVTVEEFRIFAEEVGFAPEFIYVWEDQGWKKDPTSSWKSPRFEQNDDHPVVGVSYEDGVVYCDWLSKKTGERYRLPSEAEWEYCCRAGTDTPFWWGEEITPENANYDARSLYIGGGIAGTIMGGTVPVQTFMPNPWGLYQMHGNVWEWCADAWNDNYHSSPMNGQAWRSGDTSRAPVRGGAWLSIPNKLRSAKRDWDGRDLRGNTLGLRIARELA